MLGKPEGSQINIGKVEENEWKVEHKENRENAKKIKWYPICDSSHFYSKFHRNVTNYNSPTFRIVICHISAKNIYSESRKFMEDQKKARGIERNQKNLYMKLKEMGNQRK